MASSMTLKKDMEKEYAKEIIAWAATKTEPLPVLPLLLPFHQFKFDTNKWRRLMQQPHRTQSHHRLAIAAMKGPQALLRK